MQENGLRVDRQIPVDVWFRGSQVGRFRADLIVESQVIIELKAARVLDRAHEAQLLNLLRASAFEVGLLFNFGPEPRFKRMAYSNARKTIRAFPRSSAANSPVLPAER